MMTINNNERQAAFKQSTGIRIILVIEDDPTLRRAMSTLLRREGYIVLAVADKEMGVDVARENPLSLIVVDLHQQGHQLAEFCQRLQFQKGKKHVPLLAVVPNEREIAQLSRQGLPIDDYLLSPFKWEELYACTKVLLRSEKRQIKFKPTRIERVIKPISDPKEMEYLTINDLSIDVIGRTVKKHNCPLALSSAVLFDLLVYLARRPGEVVTRGQLLECVWGYDDMSIQLSKARTVDVHIHWLREILGDDTAHPYLIQTVRGVGYRFHASNQDEQ